MRLEGRDATREKVRERDKHTCQSCFKKWKEGERRFDVHHLRGLCGKRSRKYDRVRSIPSLITFCHKCHMGKHVNRMKLRSGKLQAHSLVSLRKILKQFGTYDATAAYLGVKSSALHLKLNKK